MSAETSKWLNTLTLIGQVLKRGKAWHYREAEQGDEPNHYDHGVPVEDVKRRLFNFRFKEGNVASTYVDSEGQRQVMISKRLKTIIREPGSLGVEDEGDIVYVPTTGYKMHHYQETLLERVMRILDTNADDGVEIASAGLLKGGAIAWVQFELAENMTAEGFPFRPFYTTATSVNGDLSTTDLTGIDAVVCDNTLGGAMNSAFATLKFRHTNGSLKRLSDDAVRGALGLRLREAGEEFQAQIKELMSVEVNTKTFGKYLDLTIPVQGKEPGRGLTMATNARDKKQSMWTSDERVAPWTGTAFGLLQLENTFAHHEQAVRGNSRPQRNGLMAITGKFHALDKQTLDNLALAMA